MKKLFTFLSLLIFVSNAFAQVNVTFRVRMTGQTPSNLGVHLAGNFQNWQPDSTVMLNSGAAVYFVTLSLPEDSVYQFKFVNGNAWGMDETVPGACATTNNRAVTIGRRDTLLPAYCFGSCNVCTPTDSVNVTFRVDMQGQTVSDSGVHIAGEFEGWSPGKVKMTNVSGSIYATTFKLPSNVTYQYKFINGNAWGSDETVPAGCATTGNRTAAIGANDTTLPAVCFASCAACVIPPPPVDSVNVTFRVDMQNQTVSDSGVHIAGKFQGWSPSKSLLVNSTGTIYSKTFRVAADSSYQYKFLNGNDWPFAETVPALCGVTVDLNRTVQIGSKDTTLPVVCYSSCTACAAPPPPGDSVNVTFRVDMENENVSANGVHLAGSFQGWNPATTAMTSTGGNIYAVTLRITKNTNYQFKFINGNDWPFAETVPGACGITVDLNRTVTTGANDTTIKTVCFSSCTTCLPKTVVYVTFKVDMSNENVSPDGVHIMGNFQGWDPTGTEMIRVSNSNIFQVALPLPSGDSIQYKFVNGNLSNDAENPPAGCSMGSTSNRLLVVPGNYYVTPLVCYAKCAACILGTENITADNDIMVYPSPAKDNFTINIRTNKTYQVNIYDSEGRLVQANTMSKPLNTVVLDKFSNGIYTIRLVNNENVVVKKIVVTK